MRFSLRQLLCVMALAALAVWYLSAAYRGYELIPPSFSVFCIRTLAHGLGASGLIMFAVAIWEFDKVVLYGWWRMRSSRLLLIWAAYVAAGRFCLYLIAP